jgi:hypothetical protein
MQLCSLLSRLSRLGVTAVLASVSIATVLAAAPSEPQLIDDATIHATSTTVGGASPLPTDRTISHWFSQTTDPTDGVTYGYNMVGANPFTCVSDCSVTIDVDITPLIVIVEGQTFDGRDVVTATLNSPQFALNDYGSTTAATAAGNFPSAPALIRGGPGTLSQGDTGNQLQLEDATMRAQFNRTGADGYHLILNPHVMPAVTITVPSNQGTRLISGRGVIFADVDIGWWSAQIKNLNTSQDPTHLPVYLTNNVLLFEGKNIFNCCVIGFHGTSPVGRGAGSGNSNGNAKVQTFAWASWVQPGIYARPNGGTDWALQDIHALSHEISEWADDPFVNNTVQPWLTPTAPQYGCSGLLETGDPVVAIGFAMGTNTFQQGPNPNGTQSADGYYHPEDETFLPWFLRQSPNNISEPTQSPSANVGRYTLMGDLNPFGGFRKPATGCN